MQLELEILRGRCDVGRRFPLVEGIPLTVGRAIGVDLPLASPAVARNHCRVWREGDAVWVRDLRSRNGTYRNRLPLPGEQDERVELDDCLRVADFVLRVSVVPVIDPAWRTWEGGIVVRLVLQARQDRAVLPVLADALEEAGCVEEGVLAHLRRPGELFAGCCVLDRLAEAWGIRREGDPDP